MTARSKIVARLYGATRPLALHELHIDGVSESAASARLRELARDMIVESVRVPGKKFTAWKMRPADLTLPLTVVA